MGNIAETTRQDKGIVAEDKATASRQLTRDLPVYKLRMPPELRQQLEKQAGINGRTLHAEILDRVRKSLQHRRQSHAEQERADHTALSESERSMLAIFNRLPHEKQLALLSLFK